jgi:cytochrome c2
MIRPSKLALCGVVVGALALGASVAHAQMKVDPVLAARGETVWLDATHGCQNCHSIGAGRRAGPDLKDVTSRRTEDWLKRWLKDPAAMFYTDPIAKTLYKEYHYIPMPNLHLSDSDIEAVLNYIAQQSQQQS